MPIWEFPKTRGTLFWGSLIRILLFQVLYWGPLFSETPISLSPVSGPSASMAPKPDCLEAGEVFRHSDRTFNDGGAAAIRSST